MKLRSIWIGACAIALLGGCGGGGASDATLYMKKTFIEDSSANLLNPDRGFYDADYALNKKKDYNRFEYAYKDGYTMVYAPIDLEDYVTVATLPDTLLETIENNLKDAVDAGVKLIFRIKYNSGIGSHDARESIIMTHLSQLKPILQEYKEIISIIQAGVIGAWGEWHSFTGDYVDTAPNYKANRKAIITKLSEIFPDKYIQIRTPTHKELLYGTSEDKGDRGSAGMITEEIAYSDDIRAKIGHHNDCFLASDTDMGTYPSDDILFWQEYVINDTKYSPVGGETCADTEEFTTCTNALTQLKRFQYSYLNEAYHGGVIQRWKDEGCYQEIKENLGYRLVAKELKITKDADRLKISISIENKGYAAPYIDSEVNLILKNSTNSYTYRQSIDTRTLYSNQTKELTQTISQSSIQNGDYCLYLQIGSGYSAVRLSNSSLWDENSKTNKLACEIAID